MKKNLAKAKAANKAGTGTTTRKPMGKLVPVSAPVAANDSSAAAIVHPSKPAVAQKTVQKTGKSPASPDMRRIAHKKEGEQPARKTQRASEQKQARVAGAQSGLEMLIGLEKAVRDVEDLQELRLLIVNETRKFNGARQIFLAERKVGKSMKFKVSAISSLAMVERNNPLVLAIEKIAGRMAGDVDCTKQHTFSLSAYSQPEDELETYPFSEVLWIPLKTRKGDVFAGLCMMRERVWEEREEVLGGRLAEIYAYAWQALSRPGQIEGKLKGAPGKKALLLAAGLLLAGFIPVNLDVLAPAQIVARQPVVIAAPVDGVIEEILVKPNSRVKKDQPLFRFVNTRLYNDYQLARRAVTVAEARYKKAARAAFTDSKARHDMALAKAELDLKMAEKAYAKANYEKTVVRAPRAGLAIFHTAEEWTGKPVRIGQKVMTLADGKQTQVRIEVPVSDAIVLKNGAPLKVFLDANPLRPLKGKVTYASYEATKTPDNSLAYTVYGEFEAKKTRQPPRIGLRGTTQIYGEKVSLYFYLLRKPLAHIRQMTGL